MHMHLKYMTKQTNKRYKNKKTKEPHNLIHNTNQNNTLTLTQNQKTEQQWLDAAKEAKDLEREEPRGIARFFATTSSESPNPPFADLQGEVVSSASLEPSTKRLVVCSRPSLRTSFATLSRTPSTQGGRLWLRWTWCMRWRGRDALFMALVDKLDKQNKQNQHQQSIHPTNKPSVPLSFHSLLNLLALLCFVDLCVMCVFWVLIHHPTTSNTTHKSTASKQATSLLFPLGVFQHHQHCSCETVHSLSFIALPLLGLSFSFLIWILLLFPTMLLPSLFCFCCVVLVSLLLVLKGRLLVHVNSDSSCFSWWHLLLCTTTTTHSSLFQQNNNLLLSLLVCFPTTHTNEEREHINNTSKLLFLFFFFTHTTQEEKEKKLVCCLLFELQQQCAKERATTGTNTATTLHLFFPLTSCHSISYVIFINFLCVFVFVSPALLWPFLPPPSTSTCTIVCLLVVMLVVLHKHTKKQTKQKTKHKNMRYGIKIGRVLWERMQHRVPVSRKESTNTPPTRVLTTNLHTHTCVEFTYCLFPPPSSIPNHQTTSKQGNK